MEGERTMRNGQKLSAGLWTVQGLLALLFLLAGVMKLVTPIEVMLEQMTVPLPGWFVQFIRVCEVLGALGLVLPSLLQLRPWLTPLAASGLVLIMLGATVLTAASGPVVTALFPLVVGLLATFVAYGRRPLAPQAERSFRFERHHSEAPRRVLGASR
jgi:uncharacterized membrane protein YphA (DoxX/SURF4 family)